MRHEFTCSICKEHKTHESNCSTGYGKDENGNLICFDCCGKKDADKLEQLQPRHRFYMYLDTKEQTLSNWPGTFKIKLHSIRKGKHNAGFGTRIVHNRYDAWFDYKGNNYHAVQYGDNTQVAHIRRLKSN